MSLSSSSFLLRIEGALLPSTLAFCLLFPLSSTLKMISEWNKLLWIQHFWPSTAFLLQMVRSFTKPPPKHKSRQLEPLAG